MSEYFVLSFLSFTSHKTRSKAFSMYVHMIGPDCRLNSRITFFPSIASWSLVNLHSDSNISDASSWREMSHCMAGFWSGFSCHSLSAMAISRSSVVWSIHHSLMSVLSLFFFFFSAQSNISQGLWWCFMYREIVSICFFGKQSFLNSFFAICAQISVWCS